MSLAAWQATIVDGFGTVQASASVEVKVEASGALAALFSDRAGATPLSNPITADANGFVRFYTAGAAYKITATLGAFSREWRHVAIGLLSESDALNAESVSYDDTAAEIAAGVTPTDYSVPSHDKTGLFDARRYGLSTAASAATNSTAIQDASDVAYAAGGGPVSLAAGLFDIDLPPHIWETVSIVGAGKNSTILQKTTANASTISDSTVPFYGGGSVGFPVCVLHFVGHNGTDNWSYAECRDIQVIGNTASPNSTSTVYGFFFRGMTGGRVVGCYASFVQVGFFWGGGSTITAQISGNVAGEVQRGFYQHFMTSTEFTHNYANDYRYLGYFLSWYYSTVVANAADGGGSTWKVGTTEICVAYQGNSCRGGLFAGNGCEPPHNGSVFKFSNCISVRFISNLALSVTSNYTGGSDVCLWENDSNNSCVYQDNRMQTTSVTGTGARHFLYKITTELGNYVWQRNRFVASIADNTDTSTWANISGTILETEALPVTEGTFTGTLTGCTTSPTGTFTYRRYKNVVLLDCPSIQATSNTTAATITGMPVAIRPAVVQDVIGVTMDNNVFGVSYLQIETSGVITLFKTVSTATFTNSGTKGIGPCTVPYRLA